MCRGSSNPDGAAVVSVQDRIFGERVQVFSESVQINQGKCPFIVFCHTLRCTSLCGVATTVYF